MAADQRPRRREDFRIAVLCALPLEYNAATLAFDQFFDEDGDKFGRARGDPNRYTTGRIGKYNVVMALLPNMGTVSSASAMASFRSSYTELKLALLVGICGGVPSPGTEKEVLLGDVIISKTVVQYDFGRQNPHRFATKDTLNDSLGRPNKDIRSLLASLGTERTFESLERRTAEILTGIQQTAAQAGRKRTRYPYPGAAHDGLFSPNYEHRHRDDADCGCDDTLICDTAPDASCVELECDKSHFVLRESLEIKKELEREGNTAEAQKPHILIGGVGSGNAVMKSGVHRDEIAQRYDLVAFEMEAAGAWDEVPCVVVKGVCDYADSHKNKKWQTFAAATAASSMKALLELYIQTDALGDSRLGFSTQRINEILTWISKEPYEQHHTQNKSEVLEGTGKWLLEDKVFQSWKNSEASSILWLHGIPGSGKSKLTSIVVEDALRLSPAATVYFYCSRNPAEPGRSNPTSIAASLARQLAMPQTGADILDAAVEVYRRFEEKAFASQSLTLDETKALIHRLLLDSYQGQTITLIIDALDECDRETRQDLLDFLVSLVITPTTMKVFVSSRDDRDIVHELQKYENLHLSSERNSGDIDLYVRLETCRLVSKGSLLRGSSRKEELRNKIIFELTANAHGMFRWASLHIQELCRQATDAAIEERLAKMPRTLEGLYQEILAKIETRDAVADREVARKAFRWLLCAQEQFKSDVFLAMVSGAKDVSTATISRDQLLELCNNMVLFDETLDAFRFSHLSVREFFEGEHAYQITTAHALAAEQCLLNLDDIPSGIMPLTPIMRYSISFWTHHAKYADHEERQSRLSLILAKFFSGEGNRSSPFSRWHDRLSYEVNNADLDEIHKFNAALSYKPFAMLVICVFDLSGVLSPKRWTQLARARPRNLNGATHDELIIRYDSFQILQWQFDVGVAFNWTLKHVKIAAGSMENSVRVMLVLLERLASDIRVTEEVVQTAASNLVCGDIILSHLLEKRGREINITGDIIKAAVRNSRRGVETTSLLLKHYKSQITPEIVSAAIQNRADVVKLLLDQRGDEIEISADMILAAATNALRLDKSVLPLLLDTRRGQINITKEFLVSIASSRNCDKDLMEMLLEVCEDEVKITAELFDAVGKNPRHSNKVMMLLLDKFGTKSQIPTKFMETVVHRFSGTVVRKFIEIYGDALEVNTKIFKVAVQNHHYGGGVAAVLLEEYGDNISITEDIMEAIFDNQYCGDRIMGVCLDKCPHEIRITEKFVKMAAASRCSRMMALILNKCGGKVCITDELIASCYSATGIQAIITRRKEYKLQVTEHVLIQAARQGKGRRTRRTGDLLLPLLLEWRLEEVRHRLTEDIVIAAANNPSNGVRFITLLIDKCGDDIVITTSVLQAAASNTRCGDRLVAVLLERYGDSIRITESIVEAAVKITGVGGKVMKLLFAARGDRIPIPEKVLVRTCANCFTYEIIQMLLDRRGDHLQITEKAVGVAVQNPWCGTEILELFLERYADGVTLTEKIISLAAGNERCGDKIMSLLLKERDNIPITGAVLFAAAHNSTSGHRVMAVIIDTLSKLDEKNHQLSTALREALYEASRLGHEETVGVLLDNNADAHAQGGLENNALYAASLGGYSKVVQMLLQHNANVNTQGGQFGNALQAASFRGHYKTAELFLADPNVSPCSKDHLDRTPLFFAAQYGHAEVISTLAERDRSVVDWKDRYGSTALSVAARGGHVEVVRNLLDTYEVDINSRDCVGRTSLSWARRRGLADVSLLLETEKNGNLSREDFFLGDTDSQLSYEHATSGTPSDLVCDICTLSIPENDTCYHCSDCNGGDFDMYKDCFDNCDSCLVASHELTRMVAE